LTSSNTEIICNTGTQSATLAPDAQPIVVCEECERLKQEIRFIREEIAKGNRKLARSRGLLQEVEAQRAELILSLRD